MRKTFAALLTILMLFSLFQGAFRENIVEGKNKDISEGIKLLYIVTVEKDKPTFHISIEIDNLESGKYIFYFQEGRVENLEQYISNLQVKTEIRNLKFLYLGNLSWEVNQNGDKLFIDYDLSKILPFQVQAYRDTGQKQAAVYIDDECGIFWGQYVFMKLTYSTQPAYKIAEIRVKFNLPFDWQLVTHFIEHNGYYEVPKITNDLLNDFVNRTIYFGKMKFYAEKKAENCTVKFGIFEEDQSSYDKYSLHLWFSKKEDIEYFTDRVVTAMNELTKMFGENPYPVFSVVGRFMSKDEWGYESGVVGEIQYTSPGRFDETVGHIFYSWMWGNYFSPASADSLICKGIGEIYFGNKIAYKITSDKRYLGKIYSYWLVYKGAQGTKHASREEIHDWYYRGCVIGLWLDNLIQRETNGEKSLEDVIGYLYKKFKNTGHEISIKDLEETTDLITNSDNSILYRKYLDMEEDIPIEDYIQPYKESFDEFVKALNTADWVKDYHNYIIPFFVDVEMAIRLPMHLEMGILISSYYVDFARYILKNFDIDILIKEDIETALSKLTGENCTGFFERWNSIYGDVTLDGMKEWLKSYLPYSPKNLQASFENNSVTLGWDQVEWKYQSGYYEITGYAIYRGTSPGNESIIGQVNANTTTFADNNVLVGETYYYYVKSIENLYQEIPLFSDPSNEVIITCKDTVPPELAIYSPQGNSETKESTVIVSGTAVDKGSGMSEVKVNGVKVPISSSGSFTMKIDLTEGINSITVMAIDSVGNQATKTINVTYRKPIKTTTIILQIGNTTFTVNGSTRTLDSPPIIKNSRTLLPIRAVVESLGGTVGWDANTKKVTVSLGSTTLELWIGKSIAKVNGVDTPIDPANSKVVPEIINSRTMLPLRFVTESLGCDVQWDGTTKTITITYK